MQNLPFSPSIAFIINATYKGLLDVTNTVNGGKILLTFYVSDLGKFAQI